MINLRSLSALSLGWLFSSSGRALALPATDAAVLEAHRLARRGSDKRSSRSKPDMNTPSTTDQFFSGENEKRICVDYMQISAGNRVPIEGIPHPTTTFTMLRAIRLSSWSATTP
jgi:hypothetical protein